MRNPGRSRGFSPTLVFLRLRRGWIPVLGSVLLGVVTIWIGTQKAPLPTALKSGGAMIPMWRLLAMGVGILPALGQYSVLQDMELPTVRLRRAEIRYLVLSLAACCGSYLAIAAVELRASLLVVVARAVVGYLGLAFVAGRCFGWRMSWTIPIVVSVGLNFWGAKGQDLYYWWEFTARPYDDYKALALSLVLLCLGAVAYVATPWRMSRVLSVFGHRVKAVEANSSFDNDGAGRVA